MNILIYGYYGKCNFGDEMFIHTFKNVLSGNNITFKNSETLTEIKENTDLLICGGGDIVNEYFMKNIKIIKRNYEIKYKKHLLSYIVSVGLSYDLNNYIEYIDMFDKYIVRNINDYNNLCKRYGPQYVEYLDDIVMTYTVNDNNLVFNKRDKVGFFLATPLYTHEHYDKFVQNIAKVIDKLSATYEVELVVSDWSKLADNDDSFLCEHVYEKIINKNNVKIINLMDEIKICNLLEHYKFTVCTRFHGHVLSYMHNIPFISIASTKKTKYFMNDHGLSKYCINNISDIDELFNIVDLIEQSEQINEKNDSFKLVQKYRDAILNKQHKRIHGPVYLYDDEIELMVTSVKNKLYYAIQKYFNVTHNCITFDSIDTIFYEITNKNFAENCNDELLDILSSIISHTITNDFNSIYFWGIRNQIKNFKFYNGIKWIMHDMRYKPYST